MEKRYIRNIGALSEKEFEILRNKKVCIIGSGGLGGYIFEQLLRAGVGKITIVDYDVFDESNLNRQILATMESLGKPKVEMAQLRAMMVNPEIAIKAITEKFTEENGEEIVKGADLVIDALDSISGRLQLEKVCERGNIPLIHGAIEEWHMQIALVMPGDRLLERIYSQVSIGNAPSTLSSTVAVCASLEAAEAIKYLCGLECPSKGGIIQIDIMSLEIEKIEI